MTIQILDKSETVVPSVGWFVDFDKGKKIVGKKLFFVDADPSKTYHDEDEDPFSFLREEDEEDEQCDNDLE